MAQQLRLWIDYKYRTRRVCYKDHQHTTSKNKTITEYRTPAKGDTDLVFPVYQNKDLPKTLSLYQNLAASFAKTLDRMNKGGREDGNERRRQITLHSFRRFVKTTISDLGYADYSEYFIGHSGSTYCARRIQRKQRYFERDRAVSDILKCASTRKTRRRYTKQGRRTRTTEPINERS